MEGNILLQSQRRNLRARRQQRW